MISFYVNGDDPVKDPDFSNLRANSKEIRFNYRVVRQTAE